MTKASFDTVADWMSIVSADLNKINCLEDHSISSVSEHNVQKEINQNVTGDRKGLVDHDFIQSNKQNIWLIV